MSLKSYVFHDLKNMKIFEFFFEFIEFIEIFFSIKSFDKYGHVHINNISVFICHNWQKSKHMITMGDMHFFVSLDFTKVSILCWFAVGTKL
jgi:hypothetical protein